MSVKIPAVATWPGAGRRVPLRWRLKAAWASLHGRSVILNVALRAETDSLGGSRLAITVGDGFQLHYTTYAATSTVLVNGVPVVEIDPTATVTDISGPDSRAL